MTVGGRGRTSRPLTVFAKLHLYPPDHMAGAEMMVHSMFRALVERGHRVEVWLSRSSHTTEPYELHGVRVHPASSSAPAWGGCDVVVSHLENVVSAGSAAAQHGKPFVNVLHNDDGLTRRFLAGKTDLAVFNSEWMADAIGRDRPHIIVRPPVLADDYRTTPGDRVTLVNLNADKGAGVFWELARRMPSTRFLAVQGAYGKQIRHDLPNVDFVPHTMSMRDEVYARTRVLLMPSAYESWGRVGVEAMCSGIPVIAHPTPGLRESLGEAGIFADRDDVEAWQDALERLAHPAAWHAASRVARRRADELDPSTDLTTWCDAIERLARR